MLVMAGVADFLFFEGARSGAEAGARAAFGRRAAGCMAATLVPARCKGLEEDVRDAIRTW